MTPTDTKPILRILRVLMHIPKLNADQTKNNKTNKTKRNGLREEWQSYTVLPIGIKASKGLRLRHDA